MTERIFRCRDLAKARDVFAMAFQAAKLFTDPFEIVIRPLKAKRSVDQNRRYWVLLREVAATVWVDGRLYSDETWHRYFAGTFIGQSEVPMPNGTVELHPISTTTLNVADMGRYMEEIEKWCAEQGFPVMEAA